MNMEKYARKCSATGRGYARIALCDVDVKIDFMDELLEEYEAEDIESFLESAYAGDELSTATIKIIKL